MLWVLTFRSGWWDSGSVVDLVSAACQPWGFKRWNTSNLKWAGQELSAREAWKRARRPLSGSLWHSVQVRHQNSLQFRAQHRWPDVNALQGWKTVLSAGGWLLPNLSAHLFFPFIFEIRSWITKFPSCSLTQKTNNLHFLSIFLDSAGGCPITDSVLS